MSDLVDRDQTIWTPDGSIGMGELTYTALDGTFSGWRRREIEREYGPVCAHDPSEAVGET
jgi:hypothetical protein